MPDTETWRRSPVLYAPDARGRSAAEVLNLSAEEARHVRALRLDAGSSVRLTDGFGGLWVGRLRKTDAHGASCVLEAELDAPPGLPIDVAFAVANKAHTLWLVEKATELGVARLCPLECARSRSVADAARSPAFWRKAERRAVSAMKQSGGTVLPRIERPRELSDFLASPGGEAPHAADTADTGVEHILLDAGGSPLGVMLKEWDGSPPVLLLVGPEGGLTADERAVALEAGFVPARLGPLTLRFETAAIAAVAFAAQQIETARAGERPRRPRAQENVHEL